VAHDFLLLLALAPAGDGVGVHVDATTTGCASARGAHRSPLATPQHTARAPPALRAPRATRCMPRSRAALRPLAGTGLVVWSVE
jgi:hypothetical protein